MSAPVPDWKAIADAIATKFGAMTDGDGVAIVRGATADVGESAPIGQYAVVFPPKFEITEQLGSDDYDATFPVVILIDGSAGQKRALAAAYALVNVIKPAWNDGRLLGLATIVQNSKVTSVEPDEITEWGEPGLPGIRVSVEVNVSVPVTTRSA